MADTPAICTEAIDFLRQVEDAEGMNKQEALEDLRFRFGEQWPTEMQNSRKLESRPMFTINETDSYCRTVINQMRQQRPRGKVHPVNSTSDVKIAEVINGIGRHVEVNSDADNAYDQAAEFQVTCGTGYWRLQNDYIREDSFDQDIFIKPVDNPFTVSFDPFSTLPDGSDQTKCLISDFVNKDVLKQQYPDIDEQQWVAPSTGEGGSDWLQKDAIRVAEFYKIVKTKDDLVMLSDGTKTWADELPAPQLMEVAGVFEVKRRKSWRRKVMWYKLTASQVLEEKTLPGRYIPVFPVYGVDVIIDGKRKRFGMVRFARDPQMMVNFWQTSISESIALAPKAKWTVVEGQIEGHENEWSQANNKSYPVLTYKQKDIDGEPAPPPQRMQPEPPPEGAMTAAMGASQNLQRVLGMFDPVNLKHNGPKSGEAIRQETGQSEQSNYHFYDNLTRTIKHTWRVILDYCPTVYDTQRVMRIIGEDGKPDLVTINEKKTVDGVNQVLNDVTVGDYDVVMDTGPGYNTKRQEGSDAMMTMLATPLGEKIAQVADDLIIRNMDFPGAEMIADRLAAANPLAQIDEKSDIPPGVQMRLKQYEEQIKQLQEQLQQAGMEIKYRGGIEKMKQDAQTKRTLLQETGKAHSDQVWSEEERAQIASVERTKTHDTETRALAMQNVAEINGLVKLLTEHLQTARLNKEAEENERELAEKSASPA